MMWYYDIRKRRQRIVESDRSRTSSTPFCAVPCCQHSLYVVIQITVTFSPEPFFYLICLFMVDTYGVKITVVRTLYLPHNADFTILQHIVIRFGNASAKSISSKPNRYWFITLLTKGTSPKTSVSHTTGSLSQAFVQQIVT